MVVFFMLNKTVFKTPEGRLLAIGISMLILLVLFLGVVPLLDIGEVQIYIGMLTTNMVFGRAAGLLFGFTAQLPYGIVVMFIFAVESIMVMLIYPLFVLSIKQLIKIKVMEKYFEQARSRANKYSGIIEKYGAVALFIFVWIPFWMTGPIIGCIIGYFLGFSHTKTIALVLSGTCIAIIVWALFLHKVGEKLSTISTELMILLFVSVLIIVFFFLLRRKS